MAGYTTRITKTRLLIYSILSKCKVIKTSKDLAKAIEVCPNVVSYWNQGRRSPSFMQKQYLFMLDRSNIVRDELEYKFKEGKEAARE